MRFLLVYLPFVVFFVGCKNSFESEFQITPSGLHYRMVRQSDNPIQPEVGDEIHYNMTIRKGKQVLQSMQRYEKMPLPSNKNPILQAFQLMSLYDSMTLALLVDSFPRMMSKEFDSGDTVLIDLGIFKIRRKAEIDEELAQLHEKADKVKEEVRRNIHLFLQQQLNYRVTSSGLRYVVGRAGEGTSVKMDSKVTLDFAVFLNTGEEFESTFRKGHPAHFLFDNNRAVKGFKEGLQLLQEGSTATFFIPYDLAYGKEGFGPIPPATDIVIYVELLDVE